MIRTLLLIVLLTGCQKNAQLKAVLTDLDATPLCDTENVLTDPKDTKETLTAKVIILNYKLDCHVDYTTFTKEKINNYKKLD